MLFFNILYYYGMFVSNFFFMLMFIKMFSMVFSFKKFSLNISFYVMLLPMFFYYIDNFFYMSMMYLPICMIYNLENNFINKMLLNIICFWVMSFFTFSNMNVDLLLCVYMIELMSIGLFIYMYINVLQIINSFINKYYLILFYFFINNFIFSFLFILLLLSSLIAMGIYIMSFNMFLTGMTWSLSLLLVLLLVKFGANLVFMYKMDLYKNFNLNNIVVYTIMTMWVYILFINDLYFYFMANIYLNYYKILIFLSSVVVLSYTFMVNSISFYVNISSILTLNFLTLLIGWFDELVVVQII